MIRRILMVALAALLTLSSSAALASSSPKNLLETARPSEYQVIPIQVQVGENEQANSYGPLNSYIVECALALAVSETTNSSGNPGIQGYMQLFSCTQANVIATGTFTLEYLKRPDNTWEPAATKTVSLSVGQSTTLFYLHNSKYDYGYWRVTFSGQLSCPNCQTTPAAVELDPNYYVWSSYFFSSWTSFYDHYLKHRSEWSPSLTQMQYLQKARSLAAKAYDGDRYPNFLADTRSTDGTLIGIDLATGEIVFVHDPFAEYPYIGSAYVHNPSISGCSTHEKYWRKVVYGTPCS